jgi:hypothetical protein
MNVCARMLYSMVHSFSLQVFDLLKLHCGTNSDVNLLKIVFDAWSEVVICILHFEGTVMV